MNATFRGLVKRHMPWSASVYGWVQSIISGLAPLREYNTPYGFKLVGPSCKFIAHQASGTYESTELAWVAEMLRGGEVDLFVDAGANVGLYTMLALSHGVPVVAIEPQRKNVEAIRAGLALNGYKCRVVPVALSSKAGIATMYGLSSGSSSLLKHWHTETALVRREVQTATLDQVLCPSPYEQGSRLLIKLDLEGHEWEALLGARDTLTRIPKPVWMVEMVDFAFPGGVNPHREDTFGLFRKHGYAAWEITAGNFIFRDASLGTVSMTGGWR